MKEVGVFSTEIKSTDIRSRQINGYYKETGAGAYD